MKNSVRIFAIALAFGLAISACSGKKSEAGTESEQVEEQSSQLNTALTSGNIKEMAAAADSMSLFVDDFTPEQTVQVLKAFITVHEDAAAKRDYRRDLETMRKFVDVYDIALSVNPKDTRSAFAKESRRAGGADFEVIASEFRERLAQYDGSRVGYDSSSQAADTTATQTDSVSAQEELPLEHRPAE